MGREEWALRQRSWVFSCQSGGLLLGLAVGWCHEAVAGLGAPFLVAGVGEDLDGWAVGQVFDRA